MRKLTRILAATTLITSTVALQATAVEARCDGFNRPFVTSFNKEVYLEEPAKGTCNQNKAYGFTLRRVAVGCVSVFFKPVKSRWDPMEFKICRSLSASFTVDDDDYGSQEWFSSVKGTSGKIWNSGY